MMKEREKKRKKKDNYNNFIWDFEEHLYIKKNKISTPFIKRNFQISIITTIFFPPLHFILRNINTLIHISI